MLAGSSGGGGEVVGGGPGVGDGSAAAAAVVYQIPFTSTTQSQRGHSRCIPSIVVEAN